MNMSNHVEFDTAHTSDLAKRLLEGRDSIELRVEVPDLPSIHELMQRSMEQFDSQATGEVASPNEGHRYESR